MGSLRFRVGVVRWIPIFGPRRGVFSDRAALLLIRSVGRRYGPFQGSKVFSAFVSCQPVRQSHLEIRAILDAAVVTFFRLIFSRFWRVGTLDPELFTDPFRSVT